MDSPVSNRVVIGHAKGNSCSPLPVCPCAWSTALPPPCRHQKIILKTWFWQMLVGWPCMCVEQVEPQLAYAPQGSQPNIRRWTYLARSFIVIDSILSPSPPSTPSSLLPKHLVRASLLQLLGCNCNGEHPNIDWTINATSSQSLSRKKAISTVDECKYPVCRVGKESYAMTNVVEATSSLDTT